MINDSPGIEVELKVLVGKNKTNLSLKLKR